MLVVLLQGLGSPKTKPLGDGTSRPGRTPPADTASVPDGPPPAAPPSPVEGVATGLAADGSIQLDSGVRVRMFGVILPTLSDPPLVRQTARETLADAVRGQQLALEFDPLLTAQAQRGAGVQVGYVWLIDEAGYRRGMLNALVLAYGFGRPVTTIPYRYADQFSEAARIAAERRVGIWTPLSQ